MIYTVTINDKEYEVEVERGKANIVKTTQITTPATSVATAPVSQPTAPVAAVPTASNLGNAIKAPMPGTILDIKVTSGKKVSKGEVILILEAMKMENEIVAPTDGIISQIFVSKGASVSTGDPLVNID